MADKGFIIVEGATAYCSSSVANNAKGTAVPMEVKSQKKKLGKNKYFAQSKPVATYLDDKAESFGGGNGFGNCKGSDGKPYPCKAKCSLKYKDYYENVEFNKSMKVLLDVSTATCPGYGVPGTVAFATTGQANNVSQIDVKEADEFSVANTSPQWETSGTSSATTSVNSIAMTLPIPVAKPAGTYYYVKLPSNPLTSFFNPLSSDNLTLTAQFKGDATKIIWAIFKGEDTKDKVKTFIGLGSVFNQSLSKIFDNLSEGKYRIEAYGKKAGDKNCAIIIEVVKDFVKKIVVPGDSTLVNIPFPVSVEYKLTSQADKMKMLNGNAFMPLTTMAKWRIKQGTTILHNSDSGIASPHLVAVGSLGGTASLIFKNAGKYTLEAFTDPNDPKPESVEIKIENTLSVMGVSGEPGLLRSGDMLKIQASKFNVAYLPAAGKTVHWYLKREGSGRITAFESSSSFKTAVINKKADAFLSQDAHLSSGQYIGKYIMEAYASPLGSTKQPAFTGSDTFHFEIINNVIDKFTLPAGNIPKGTKVKYTGTARIATLAGNEAIKVEVPQNVTDNGDGTLTFNELGEYTISAYLTGSNTDNKKIETKIKVSQPTVKRALWAYGTGVKRTETGFGEETYGFVEIDGLQNQALKVKIWVKGEGDDFYKQKEQFMLEEKSVTLDSQGKASFMINTTEDYKKKLAETIPKTTENPTPTYRLVFTIELQSGTATDVVLPANISIEGTRPVVIDATTTYLEVLDSNEELVITSEQKIVSIMFSSEDGKSIQREQTFYGKTHKIWVHTVNMTEEILKIDVFKEVPKEGLNERDHIVYTHESKETYKEEKTGKDGLLEVSFTAKEEWKTPPKNFDYYIAQVSRQLKDPADPNKKIWKAEKMQVTLNDSLPASLVRTEDMEKLGIKAYKQDGTPFTQEEMLELRKQFIFYEAGCLKVSQKATPEAIDNEVMPVVVEMAEVKREGGGCPRCNAPITADQLKEIFPNADPTVLAQVAAAYTKYMKEIGMNSCWNKAHLFAQARVETGTSLHLKEGENFNWYWEKLPTTFAAFKTTEGRENAKLWGRPVETPAIPGVTQENQKNIANWAYSPTSDKGKEIGNTQEGDGWNFRGKGLIQLTGRKAYAYANTYTKKEGADIIIDPDLVLTNIAVSVISSMAFFKWKGINTIVNGSKDTLPVSKKVGKMVATKDEDGKASDNYKEKQKAFDDYTSKTFKTSECEWGKAVDINLAGRSPWMENAIAEAKTYGGKDESTIDSRIKTYHKDGGGTDAGSGTAWCASFVCWCIEQKNLPSPHSAGSRMFLDSPKAEKCEVFFGAVAIFSDCNSTGSKIETSGHATFVFGKLPGTDVYACLGGNQSDKLKMSSYNCSGSVFVSWTEKNGTVHYKIFRGFYKPKGYVIKDIDKLNNNDNYSSADEASKKALNLDIKSDDNGESST
ncbi:DUF4280 domain-containing protein [Chryseobacterium sp. ERMR1:04]|uniref:DUF4280 domain-containing protein n=1 Tax=Chryseobacterium sp. ERMR1:04 TaxID=1705393 RepID=UPI0006C83445|nr:DUF4280 domain-containing protein [Chryseobacterium sp. ERMR1:04]KPH11859.1 hypothetical protein AMQ68_21130 [Chryseobacterium sp. ERMR1:04]